MPRETPTAHLDTARDRVRGRRRELVDERDAFDQFCQHVERLPVTDSGTAAASDRAATVRTADPRRAIHRAFERTVLAAPHYRERYGDPAAERLAAELGPDLAAALDRTTGLTASLKTRVLDAVSVAHERRTTRIAALDEERTRLDRTERAVHDLLTTLGAVDGDAGTDPKLTRVERRCESLLADRRAIRADDATDCLLADVYADCPVDDPVVATVESVVQLATVYRADA
ncbi:DUF7260 family protein [Halorientalis marina]|uniref:DUF7260 family protein n=1 Tax=Halorientalis marina TaxID=2931976 RepID=UPI001FF22A3E|nr:hypothetical protein [Halorientalis marina]